MPPARHHLARLGGLMQDRVIEGNLSTDMSAVLSLMFFMLFIAYSTLLHFLTEDFKDQYIPAKKLLFPWPSRGKFVSLLALCAAGFFLWVAVLVLRSPGELNLPLPGTLLIVGIFFVFPFTYYSISIYRGLARDCPQFPGQLAYKPVPFTPKDYRMLMGGVVAINGTGFILIELRKYFNL